MRPSIFLFAALLDFGYLLKMPRWLARAIREPDMPCSFPSTLAKMER